MGGRGSSFHGSGGGTASTQNQAAAQAAPAPQTPEFNPSDYKEWSVAEYLNNFDALRATQYVNTADHMAIQVQRPRYVKDWSSLDINKAVYTNADKDISDIAVGRGGFQNQRYKDVALALERATTNNTLNRNLLLFRAVNGGGSLGISQQTINDIMNGTTAQRNAAINSLVGLKTKSNGFMSTSATTGANFFTGYSVHRKLYAPKGTKGFVTKNKLESEIILPKNTQTEVFKVEYSGGKLILHERIISQP